MNGRVLLVGASGMLGTDLKEALSQWAGAGNLLAPSHAELDVTSPAKVFRYVLELQPRLVVNATAYTNVDKAETEIEAARVLNEVAPKALAHAASELRVPFIHFSTDQVFDGSGEKPWEETDTPNALNVYASTKLAGEREVLTYPLSVVFRVQWLYGVRKDRFTILKDKEVFTPFVDQFGAPTSTQLISRVAISAAEKQLSGLYHLAHDDSASWFEVYQFVKEQLGVPTRLEPKLTDEVKLPARRPKNSRMSNRKLCTALGVSGFGSWKEPLSRFLHERSANG